MPETRYAKGGDLHIAYQVLGQGPPDVIVLPEWVTHLEQNWEFLPVRRFLRRMASYSRLIIFDKRGIGLSDPVPLHETVSLDAWMDDVRIVQEAAGSERAALIGHGQGATMALLFAATFPERVSSLVLVNAYARLSRAPDYREGIPSPLQEQIMVMREAEWGTAGIVPYMAPDLVGDPSVEEWWSRMERLACSPGTARSIFRATFEHDVRSILSAISLPTLVVHVTDDQWIRVAHGRYLAEHIPGARYAEFPGKNHWFWVGESAERIDAEIQEFITGGPAAVTADRVLSTLLFTDVVQSTEQAVAMGDDGWRKVLDDLDALAERQIKRFGGRVVKSTGDGHLATFDGPGRALRCSQALRDAVRSLGIELRIGVHTGEIEVRGADIGGVAVHIAARVMALAGAGEILVSGVLPPLVAGSGFEFADRGVHELRDVPGEWAVHELHT